MKREGPGGTPDSDNTTNPEGNSDPTDAGDLRERMLDLADELEAEADDARAGSSGLNGFEGDDFAAAAKVDAADRIRERVEQIVTDGGLDAPTPEERERRARQSGIGFIVRCRKANVDPHETLDDVLEELDEVGGDDDDDREPKAVLPDGGDA